MDKFCRIIVALFIVSFIGIHVHVLADSTPAFENEVKRINQITDKMRLQTMLKSAYDRHDKNVLQMRLLLLESEIVAHYGDLQFTYSFRQVKDKTYTMGGWQTCVLYVEHISVKIIDVTEEIVQQFRFSGRPGGSQETFSTFNGMCSSKTNEAFVNVAQIRNDLLKKVPTPTPAPTPVPRDYETRTIKGNTVVIDSDNGLMWQQAGSPTTTNWQEAQEYLNHLNHEQFAGYADWRFPTIEELKCLLESIPKNGSLSIDPIFDPRQAYCWATDNDVNSPNLWYLSFLTRTATTTHEGYAVYVRTVRSMHNESGATDDETQAQSSATPQGNSVTIKFESVQMFSQPAFKGTFLEELIAGTKLEIIDETPNWYHVKTPGGNVGWVAKQWVE